MVIFDEYGITLKTKLSPVQDNSVQRAIRLQTHRSVDYEALSSALSKL